MPTHAALAILLGVVAADSVRTKRRARKTRKESQEAEELFIAAYAAFKETHAANRAHIEFLHQKLDDYEVPMTEFDRLVIKFHS